MKLRMILLTVFIAGCSHGQVQFGSSSAGLRVQASGSTAAALIDLGIAGAVIYRGTERTPELAPVRRVNEQDCTRPIEDISANLKCR